MREGVVFFAKNFFESLEPRRSTQISRLGLTGQHCIAALAGAAGGALGVAAVIFRALPHRSIFGGFAQTSADFRRS
jgi:hypothetical protein